MRLWLAITTLAIVSVSSLQQSAAQGRGDERSRAEAGGAARALSDAQGDPAGDQASDPASDQTSDPASDQTSDPASDSASDSASDPNKAQEPSEAQESGGAQGRESESAARAHPKLDRLLADVVRRATAPMLPDGVNGLIRVMVPTTRGDVQDRQSREVLSAVIAQMVAELPHHFAVNTARVVDVMRDFDRGDQQLTTPRSISLGQHLGARYVLQTELSEGGDANSLTLDVQVISVKRRGAIHRERVELSRLDYEQLRTLAVFDERRLSATWRSALIPGWGQLYQGRTGVAVAYAAITIGLTAGALWTRSLGREATSRYQEDTPDGVRYRFEANNHFARSQLMWGALGVTWLSSLASAYLQGEDRSHIKLNFDPAQGGINISGAF